MSRALLVNVAIYAAVVGAIIGVLVCRYVWGLP
jgi:hypothetical protein